MHQCNFPIYQEDDPIFVSSFGIERVGEEAKWGPGRRTEGIVHYVLSGKGIFNGHAVHENQGFYIAPNSFCDYYPDPQEPWNYFWMNCSEELAQRYVLPSVKPDGNGIFDYDFRGKLLSLIEKVFSSRQPMSSVEALSYAFSILKLHTPSTEVSRSQHYVRQAKNYIESSLNRKLTVCDVADAISIHDRYLYTLFIQYEGISPKEYILKRKIETAADLLEHTSLSIMEIAAASGFPDVYSFSRLFKAKTGMPPSQYRNTIK